MTDVIEATVVEDAEPEPGTEIVQTGSHTLFRTDDPVEVVTRATQVADALKGVLDRQGLTAQISGKRHVLVEGWTTLGAMVGVTAVPAWTKPLEGDAPTGKAFGYEARVEARTLDGRVIGAAEAMCTRSENRWKTADDYAIRSMAQTRATSKALRGPLGFVVTLAGYQATPAEEMPHEPAQPAVERCSREQYDRVLKAFAQAQKRGLPLDDFLAQLDAIGAPKSDVIGNRVKALQGPVVEDLVKWLVAQHPEAKA